MRYVLPQTNMFQPYTERKPTVNNENPAEVCVSDSWIPTHSNTGCHHSYGAAADMYTDAINTLAHNGRFYGISNYYKNEKIPTFCL